jgi:hypothetical protein
MRTIETIAHPQFLISIMYMNEKFILRIETGPYEQLYKFTREMCSSAEEVKAMVNETFLSEVAQHFNSMHHSLLNRYQEVKNKP